MENEKFTTPRLEEAAFLIAKGFSIDGTSMDDRQYVSFVFKQSNAKQILLDYYNGGMNVDARKFHEAYRDLRGIGVRLRKEKENADNQK